MGDLIELNFNFEIMKNSVPKFKGRLTTKFTIAKVGDLLEYKLPDTKDKEDNDIIEVLVEKSGDFEFPPYLFYNNITRTLIFKPHSVWYQGRDYQFDIVIKEKHSSDKLTRIPCKVIVEGEMIKF